MYCKKCGKEIDANRLSEIFFELRDKGAHNINLVSPTPYIPEIAMAIKLAKKQGLDIPIVYNSSGYELCESLKRLDGLVDIYLPDFKYMSADLAKKYSNVPDYPEHTKNAIAEMVRQQPSPKFIGGMMKEGVIVRHLVLPGNVDESKNILLWIKENLPKDIYISLMNQYTPYGHIADFKELNRRLTTAEYHKVVDYFLDIGLENGFVQEKSSQRTEYIPDFDMTGVK